MTLLDELDFRGLIYQVTDRDGLAQRLASGPMTLYVGFDPTADSLQIGTLVTVLLLRRFQQAGHHPVALVGGGTGLIGDPGGKLEERVLNPVERVKEWSEKIKLQLEPYLDFDAGIGNPARLVNNFDWLGEMDAIQLLRDVGKHFPVPYMLAKESVSSRLETGISYTEFSYMILQSYDYLKLNEMIGCELQVGGSDQWGNITAGCDLIRRVRGGKSFGLTCPLVTTADGAKFGKSEAGTLWLSAERTSSYQFYQFWINADDRSVVDYLKIFTFLDPEAIGELAESVEQEPGRREAQRVLAGAVTSLAHGPEAARKAEKISRALFYGRLDELTEDELELGFDDVPTHDMKETELGLVDLLVTAGISSSKRQARQDIGNGAIYLNGRRCTQVEHSVRKADGLHGRYIVVRRGKSRYFLVR